MNIEDIAVLEDESDHDILTHVLKNQEQMLANQSDLKQNQHYLNDKLDDIIALLRDNSLVNTQILDRVHAIIS